MQDEVESMTQMPQPPSFSSYGTLHANNTVSQESKVSPSKSSAPNQNQNLPSKYDFDSVLMMPFMDDLIFLVLFLSPLWLPTAPFLHTLISL
jgi:hypothetical protein